MTSATAAGTLAAVTSLQHFISWQHPKVLACDTDPAICKEAYRVSTLWQSDNKKLLYTVRHTGADLCCAGRPHSSPIASWKPHVLASPCLADATF